MIIMTSGIYYIKNLINDKYYIGQSVNIDKRFSQHFSMLRNNNHHNTYLQNAFNKYGAKNFEFKLIKSCKPKYLNRFERVYIKKYDSYNNGYNLTEGGESFPLVMIGIDNPFYRHSHSDKTCLSLSKKRNSSGYFRVYQTENTYKYRWHEDGKRKSISSKNIDKLKEKVLAKGLEWKCLSNINPNLPDLYQGKEISYKKKVEKSKSQNSTGYFRVGVQREKGRQDRYYYQYRINGKRKRISSTNINKLEKKVKNQGLPWQKL